MIEDFFNHKCDIYHIEQGEQSPGYSLPNSASFTYPDEPQIIDQACHFCTKSQSVTITQQEPMAIMDARIKLVLPLGTDIRLNDKIINKDTKLEYTAEQPVKVQNHHLYVYVKRVERQKAL